jgi:uncharacterized protein YoxC
MFTVEANLAKRNHDLRDVHDDLGYFTTPLSEVHTLLHDIQGLLHEPDDLNKKLGEILDVLEALEATCRDGEWIPEVGEDAKSAAEVLDGMNRFIKEARSALTDIQHSLDPFSGWLNNVQRPVNKAWKPVGQVEARIEAAVNVTGTLLRHYEGKPPAAVEECAGALDKPVDEIARVLNDAKDEANSKLNEAEQPLRTAYNQLDKITDYTAFIDSIYNRLGELRRAIREITSAVRKVADYGKEAIERAISEWAKKFAHKTYARVKKMLAEVQRAVNRLKSKIVNWAFKPIKDLIDRVNEEVKSKLANLPELQPIESALEKVAKALGRVESALDAQSGPCKSMFEGATAPA